jgi:hypothetical protein
LKREEAFWNEEEEVRRKKEGRGVKKEEDESKKEWYLKREEIRVWKSNELYENRRRKRVRRKKEI